MDKCESVPAETLQDIEVNAQMPAVAAPRAESGTLSGVDFLVIKSPVAISQETKDRIASEVQRSLRTDLPVLVLCSGMELEIVRR